MPDEMDRRFTLGPVLGEGGMATVYEGIDTDLDRTVAVKCIKASCAERADLRERFEDEARILAGLGHPGAVPVYARGVTSDGLPFYAMKRVRGRTLRELLHRRSREEVRDPSTRARFIDIFERVCQAIAAAHAESVIHRDLKPDNVMVDEFGAVYVVDWGLAKRLSDSGTDRTHTGAVMGTPAYMSPEIASGGASTSGPAADVFSLGVMLYEVLAGTQPFQGADRRRAVLEQEPQDPRKHNPRAGRVLSAICLKALARDVAQRYADAGELADDIRRVREFLPVAAAPPGPIARLANQARRRPALAAALATMLVVGGLAGSVIVGRILAERRMHSQASDVLDEFQERLLGVEREIGELDVARGGLAPDDPQVRVLDLRLRDAAERREVLREAVRVVAFAISGMTRFSAGEPALRVARDDVLGDIEQSIETANWYRSRALIEQILDGEGRNWMGFSPAQYALLRSQAERVTTEIRALEDAPGDETRGR